MNRFLLTLVLSFGIVNGMVKTRVHLSDGEKLLRACKSGQTEIVKFLLDAGVDKDMLTPEGSTVLYIAVDQGYYGVVKVLLDAGADANKFLNGPSPLYRAAELGYLAIVELLLQAGADRTLSYENEIPLLVATRKGHIHIVEFMKTPIKSTPLTVLPIKPSYMQGKTSSQIDQSEVSSKSPMISASLLANAAMLKSAAAASSDKSMLSSDLDGRSSENVVQTDKKSKAGEYLIKGNECFDSDQWQLALDNYKRALRKVKLDSENHYLILGKMMQIYHGNANGVEVRPSKVIKYARILVAQSVHPGMQALSCLILAECLFEGRGLSKDFDAALEYAQKAAQQSYDRLVQEQGFFLMKKISEERGRIQERRGRGKIGDLMHNDRPSRSDGSGAELEKRSSVSEPRMHRASGTHKDRKEKNGKKDRGEVSKLEEEKKRLEEEARRVSEALLKEKKEREELEARLAQIRIQSNPDPQLLHPAFVYGPPRLNAASPVSVGIGSAASSEQLAIRLAAEEEKLRLEDEQRTMENELLRAMIAETEKMQEEARRSYEIQLARLAQEEEKRRTEDERRTLENERLLRASIAEHEGKRRSASVQTNKQFWLAPGEEDLWHAAQSGHTEHVARLLVRGADKNEKNVDGITPLHVATAMGNVEVVRLLLRAGADIDKELHLATGPCCWPIPAEVVRLLLDAGANKDQVDSNGRTPLLLAVKYNKIEMVRLLLKAGANRNKADKYGRTPLDEAQDAEIIGLLHE